MTPTDDLHCPMSGVSACPFLRSVKVGTDFSFLGGSALGSGNSAGSRKGPIFADADNFEEAYKLFHGDGGVVPLSRSLADKDPVGEANGNSRTEMLTSLSSSSRCPFFGLQTPGSGVSDVWEVDTEGSDSQGTAFHAALASAPMASLGLSAFGGGLPFGFDSFKNALDSQKKERARKEELRRKEEQQRAEQNQQKKDAQQSHEALGDDWLATGKCPIARSFRAFSHVIPAVTAAFKPPPGVKYVCPPAIVALRAAVAKSPAMQKLRPQALPIRVLAIGTMGLFLNIPLGAWREHLEKFSPQWILVVHASVPFVAVLRKAALMPKYAMAFTVAASILGQTIGSRLERQRLTAVPKGQATQGDGFSNKFRPRRAKERELGAGLLGLGLSKRETVLAYDCKFVHPSEHGCTISQKVTDSGASVVSVAA